MMLSEIKTLAYDMIGDVESDPQYITSAMMDAYANEATARICQACRNIEKRQSIVLTANVGEYDLPDDCERVIRVVYDGLVLLPITQAKLRLFDDAWRDEVGTPRWYYLDELNSKIGLYPRPNSGTTLITFDGERGGIVDTDDGGAFSQERGIIVEIIDAGNSISFDQEEGEVVQALDALYLEVFYNGIAPTLDSGDDIPEIPTWAHHTILFHILSQSFEADTMLRDYGMSEFWSALATKQVMRLKARSNSKLNKVWVREGMRSGPLASRERFNMPDHIEEP